MLSTALWQVNRHDRVGEEVKISKPLLAFASRTAIDGAKLEASESSIACDGPDERMDC
jgi:hypothetical protein